jgi:hypothetical protein
MKLYRHVTANSILLKPMPFIRELSMEAYLIENEAVLRLNDDDFSEVQIIDSELPVPKGRPTRDTDGRIDLLALYNSETLGIIELKNAVLGQEHFKQLQEYFSQKDEIYSAHKDAVNSQSGSPRWIGVLVGTGIEPGLQEQLVSGTLKISDDIAVAALVVSRYRSDDGQVFVTVDSFYRNVTKDRTKYSFNGEIYGKGRLALALVRKYIEDHPSIQFADLQQAFPKKTQGALGVFATLEDAQAIFAKWGFKRHFIEEDELLKVGSTTVAVCSQWGIGNIGNLIALARALKYKVEEVKA